MITLICQAKCCQWYLGKPSLILWAKFEYRSKFQDYYVLLFLFLFIYLFIYSFIYLSVYSLSLLGFVIKIKNNNNDKNSWSEGFMYPHMIQVNGLESRMIAPCKYSKKLKNCTFKTLQNGSIPSEHLKAERMSTDMDCLKLVSAIFTHSTKRNT